MNGINVFADTNIIVYLLDGNKRISELLDGNEVYISFITQLELFGKRNLTKDEKRKIEGFINQCIVIDINAAIKQKVIALREKYPIKLPDAIIAATAMEYDMPLFTSDKQISTIKELTSLIVDI